MKTSCLILEDESKWRPVIILFLIGTVLLPIMPLVVSLVSGFNDFILNFNMDFLFPLGKSLLVAASVCAGSIFIGLPVGFILGVYSFKGRRIFLGLLALPLIVPSFLWAIGLSGLRISMGLPQDSLFSGFSGTVFAFTSLAIPIVTFYTLASAQSLSQNQIESARLIGGDICLIKFGLKSLFPTAALAGIFAGILSLSDPGPGQILGFSGAASEILTSFAALFDFSLASQQCALLSFSILIITIPFAIKIAPSLSSTLMSKESSSRVFLRSHFVSSYMPCILIGVLFFILFIPLFGIISPAVKNFEFERAWSEIMRTSPNTLFYSLFAAVLSSIFGFGLAIIAGRKEKFRIQLIIILLVLFSLPPALSSLGWVNFSTSMPAGFDFIFRSRFTVILALAIRFLPISTLIALRSFGMSSPSWTYSGAILGVPLHRFLIKVLFPYLMFSFLVSILIISLLSLTEVGTVLLLRPPGEDTLPVQIFTIMANAPESLVSTLCTFYLSLCAVFIFLMIILIPKGKTT